VGFCGGTTSVGGLFFGLYLVGGLWMSLCLVVGGSEFCTLLSKVYCKIYQASIIVA
jgi:hypothetical protein